MKANINKLIIASVFTIFTAGKSGAQCTTGCTQTVTPATSAAYYNQTSGKLCIPEGIIFTGTIDIHPGAIVENCGQIRGTINIKGGLLNNHALLAPNTITLNTGELTNYDSMYYAKGFRINNGRFNNTGRVGIKDSALAFNNSFGFLGGRVTVATLTTANHSHVSTMGEGILTARDLVAGSDSFTVAANSALSVTRLLTIGSTSRMFARGTITAGTIQDNGKLVVNEDMLVLNDLKISRTGELIQNTDAYIHVTKRFLNNDGLFIAYATTRVGGLFRNDGYVNLNDGAKMFVWQLTNNSILDGCGCATCVRGIRVSDVSANYGDLLGEFDFCDSVNGTFDIQAGYIAPGITFCAALPVKWLTFTAENQDKAVTLKWSTASEYNNSHFEVQKSENGSEWMEIGRVIGNGTAASVNKYEFVHALNTSAPAIYFRLKQVDYDGKFEYSTVAVVRPGMNKAITATVLGNPFTNNLDVTFASKLEGHVNIELMNVNGQVLISENKELVAGSNNYSFETSNIKSGIYFLRVSVDGIHTETVKVIK